MHSFAERQSIFLSVAYTCSCDKIYHKQEVRFKNTLYLLGQIVIWQNNPYPLD